MQSFKRAFSNVANLTGEGSRVLQYRQMIAPNASRRSRCRFFKKTPAFWPNLTCAHISVLMCPYTCCSALPMSARYSIIRILPRNFSRLNICQYPRAIKYMHLDCAHIPHSTTHVYMCKYSCDYAGANERVQISDVSVGLHAPHTHKHTTFTIFLSHTHTRTHTHTALTNAHIYMRTHISTKYIRVHTSI